MSLLLVLVYFVGIPALVIAAAVWLWRKTNSSLPQVLVMAGAMTTLAGLLWLAEGEKWQADRQVRELCAKDGGVRVYETVRLPPEEFNRWGQVRIPSKKNAGPEDAHFYEASTTYLKHGNPEIWQSKYKVYRQADNKLLGESLGYARRGGDLPGPWHESSFACPVSTDITDLNRQIFIKNSGENYE